ncbi:HNH endonuclease [Alcaligenaceae bacterium]|nr:HNH endonuclease [Alcaligenaceae bacterium]
MRRPWTQCEIDTLTKLYPDKAAKAISLVLDRSVRSIYSMGKQHSLKKSDTFFASPASGRLDGVRGESGRFKPGLTPWNKGQAHPSRGRSAETQFKKGEMSGAAQHNYVPIGSTRITRDGSLERKVTDDPDLYPAKRWVPVARLVWEATHGPIPDKQVVRFLPGMQTTVEDEITLDKLECISLAENMRRNTLHRYPKEIALAIQMRGALNRKINNVEKQKHQ